MYLKSIELAGFKSFGKKTLLEFSSPITGIVGPNGSGKSNVAEAFRFVLGEQSMKSMRGKRGEDLIWSGGKTTPRAGRGSVKLVFDNAKKIFSLDFDEVAIERVVHRDGINEYLLNGSQVRLKDVVELLAQANIGASGHHIISQGEADRILSAGNRERREMIEDALGLKAYLYKRHEAEVKLEKTGENIAQVESLRREIAPHLRFLGAQVKKIEEAKALREELKEKYLEYMRREHVYLTHEAALVASLREAPAREKASLDERVKHVREGLEGEKARDGKNREIMTLEASLRDIGEKRAVLLRDMGATEGELRALVRQRDETARRESTTPSIPYETVSDFAEGLQARLAEGGKTASLESLQTLVGDISRRVREFLASLKGGISNNPSPSFDAEIVRLTRERERLEEEAARLKREEAALLLRAQELKGEMDSARREKQEGELELYELMTRRGELERELAEIKNRESLLVRAQEDFKRELQEAGVLVGRDILGYEEYEVHGKEGRISPAEMLDEVRSSQEERRRKLEKMKIRLEEAGGGSSEEVLREHRDVSERDAFLAREIEDLEQSAASLNTLIEDLTKTLEVRFAEGIEKINLEFDAFFKLMFGAGNASLKLTQERVRGRFSGDEEDEEEKEEETEQGIEISIHLPHKRIKGIHMLSGGERALTSIALIFAMSQVNPPPFIILDETDAALDEANSRRYGDMVANLAKKSQLILITHNRETMSRAGVLYGVTMGSEGMSRILSVKFEEAVAVAK